jgi:ferrous iron transport protein B
LIDLPGTYSLAPRSPDEMVAVDLLLGQCAQERRPDVILAIVDASNLDRHLYLTTQLLELGLPVVIALNMVDVAAAQGIAIDAAMLESRLGTPVVSIQANKGAGLDQLKDVLIRTAKSAGHAPTPVFPAEFDAEAAALGAELPGIAPFLVRRLLLDIGGYTESRLAAQFGTSLTQHVASARDRLASAGHGVPAVEAKTRYAWIRQKVAGCVTRPAQRPVTWTDRIDRVVTHRVWGTLIFMAVMLLIFQAIFNWATPLMDLVSGAKDGLSERVGSGMSNGPLKGLITKGVIEGVGGVLVFLPQILILFAFIAVLEDCGYMARAAFLMDRLMSRCGLSGKSFIPMLSSLACAVPGIMATRVIENRRDRFVTILVAPLMSCSARLPVYLLMIGAFVRPGRAWWVPGVVMFCMYLIGPVAAAMVALLLKRTLLKGETPVFVMEMPTYKWPSFRTILRRVLDAGWEFIRRAGTIILATMVLVWALLNFPQRDAQGRLYQDRLAEVDEAIAAAGASRSEIEESIDGKNKERSKQGADASPESVAILDREIADLEKRVAPYYQTQQEWISGSYLGQFGKTIEPVVRPLGWDWRIGVASLASFPAREVVVGTLGILFNVGEVDAGSLRDAEDPGDTRLGRAMRSARRAGSAEQPAFAMPTALSLMVFFALCCQCGSTLAVIRRETKSWSWPAFTFVYMTGLAYVAALLTYQISSRLV